MATNSSVVSRARRSSYSSCRLPVPPRRPEGISTQPQEEDDLELEALGPFERADLDSACGRANEVRQGLAIHAHRPQPALGLVNQLVRGCKNTDVAQAHTRGARQAFRRLCYVPNLATEVAASILFSTNSATAFSGLSCDGAMMLIADQWSPMRSLPAASFLRAVDVERAKVCKRCGTRGQSQSRFVASAAIRNRAGRPPGSPPGLLGFNWRRIVDDPFGQPRSRPPELRTARDVAARTRTRRSDPTIRNPAEGCALQGSSRVARRGWGPPPRACSQPFRRRAAYPPASGKPLPKTSARPGKSTPSRCPPH